MMLFSLEPARVMIVMICCSDLLRTRQPYIGLRGCLPCLCRHDRVVSNEMERHCSVLDLSLYKIRHDLEREVSQSDQ